VLKMLKPGILKTVKMVKTAKIVDHSSVFSTFWHILGFWRKKCVGREIQQWNGKYQPERNLSDPRGFTGVGREKGAERAESDGAERGEKVRNCSKRWETAGITHGREAFRTRERINNINPHPSSRSPLRS